MDAKAPNKKRLVVPAALAIAVLASGCGGPTPPGNDAALADAGVTDSGGAHDAGCVPPYEQIDDTCQVVV